MCLICNGSAAFSYSIAAWSLSDRCCHLMGLFSKLVSNLVEPYGSSLGKNNFYKKNTLKKHFLYSSGYFAQHFFHFLSILFIFPVFQRIAQLTLKPMLKKVSKYFAQQFFLICLAQKNFCNLLKPYGSSTLWSHRAPHLCSAFVSHLLSIFLSFAQHYFFVCSSPKMYYNFYILDF